MKIISATVLLTRSGPDRVILETDFPCPFVPTFLPSQPPLDMSFDATCDTGVDYVRKNFNMEPTIIDTR